MKAVIKKIQNAIFHIRLTKAIKKANKYHELTKHKYMVLMWGKKPVVKAKQNLKVLIKNGTLKCTIQQLEAKALYITI